MTMLGRWFANLDKNALNWKLRIQESLYIKQKDLRLAKITSETWKKTTNVVLN